MRKADIVNRLADETGFTKKDANTAVEGVLDAITDGLARGEEIQFIGFGKFYTVEVPESQREMFGDMKTIPAQTSVRFRAGKTLRDNVNA